MIAFLDRLTSAVNDHDLDAVVACFTTDYVNETPAHPGRGFVGDEQVRVNWSRIFGAVPDVRAEIVAASSDGNRVWSEWEMRGTRPDGAPHLMRGVVIFDLDGDRAKSARFYLEIVDAGEGGVDAAISQIADARR